MKNEIKTTKKVGHEFLMELGKKRLRPGGIKGTNYLIEFIKKNYDNYHELKILEISCNIGLTSIELAKELNCKVIGIDINKKSIDIAKENVNKANLQSNVEIIHMDGSNLKFEDESFDIVINEAMLTMYKQKELFLKEYNRVLKKGGFLLNHDICIKDKSEQESSEELKQIINLKPYPLTLEGWQKVMLENNFKNVDYLIGEFTLLTIKGLLKDEGLINMFKILIKGNKKENKNQFSSMRKYFLTNKNKMLFIAMVNQKI